MTIRVQRIVWILLGLIAVGLSAATVWLLVQSRGGLDVQPEPYRIAYASVQSGASAIMTCNVRGGGNRSLTAGNSTYLFPVCEPMSLTSTAAPRIAFVRLEGELGNAQEVGAPGGIYVVSSKGGEPTMVSRPDQRVLAVAPAWSPQGSQLAFAAVEDLNGDRRYSPDEAGVYVSELDTGQVRRLVAARLAELRLLWSPDGPQILVPALKQDSPVAQVHLLNVDNGKFTALLGGHALSACWSPDGQYIAAYSAADLKIHVVRPDGSEVSGFSSPSGSVIELWWAPTGLQSGGEPEVLLLAVTSPGPTLGAGQIWARSTSVASSQAWRSLTAEDDLAFYINSSPDGRYLVYTLVTGSGTSGRGSLPATDLCLLELDSGRSSRLTSDPGFEGLATWLPDGR